MDPSTVLALCLLVSAADDPPTLEYGGSRASSDWITTPDGLRVAVDRGLEWQGVRVYLSLTFDLIGVDVESGVTLWCKDVGAFWQKIGFAEIDVGFGKNEWCVELAPSSRTRDGSEARQYHLLRTGAEVVPAAAKTEPPGKAVEVRHWTRPECPFEKPFRMFVSSREHWQQVRARLCPDLEPEGLDDVDFEKELILVFALGKVTNCRGLYPVEARKIEDTVRLRVGRHTFQTLGGGVEHQPWAAIVLPRHEGRWVVERNAQGLIRGPAIWKEVVGWEKRPAVEKELEPMPRRRRSL